MRHHRLTRARAARRAVAAPFALATLLAVAAPAAARAQRIEPPWERRSRITASLEGGGLYSVIGSQHDGPLGDGYGFDAQGNLGIGPIAIGVGYLRTTQPVDGVAEDATYEGVYVEPHYALQIGYGSFSPYLTGRVGRVRFRTPDAVGGSGDGTLLGAGVGVLLAIAPNVHLNVAGLWSQVNLSDATPAPADGLYVDGEGSGLLLRAGLVLGFRGWGR